MPCSKCSADLDSRSVCGKCSSATKQDIIQKLEEFLDATYPPNQYKTFNARVKAKIKEIVDEKDSTSE